MELSEQTRSPLAFALGYAKRGLRVLPLHSVVDGVCSCGNADCHSSGKHPHTKNGVKDATRDPQTIRAWWQRWPNANVGIATGMDPDGSGFGLLVIDVDVVKGADPADLEVYNGSDLTGTWSVSTGSKGYHFYLRCSVPLPNTAGKLGAFIDTRGEGGYVVAPPSRNQHGPYVWMVTRDLREISPALLAALQKGHKVQPVPQVHVENTLADVPAAQIVASAATGALTSEERGRGRNAYLMSMGGVVLKAGLDVEQAKATLLFLNDLRYGNGRHPEGPLSQAELERTVFVSLAKYAQQTILDCPPQVDMLQEVMAQVLPEAVQVVPGLLNEGLCIFAGKPKMGKSWLGLDTGITCAIGTANGGGLVLGRYPVEPCGVLYLSLEDSERRFQSRVEQLLHERPVPERFGRALHWKPFHLGGQRDLESYLVRTPDTRLVIIDTLACVRPPMKAGSNAYQEDYEFFKRVQQLAMAYHVAIVFVHHLRKSAGADVFDEVSGSTGITGCADTLLILQRERHQNEAKLSLSGRDVVEEEMALVFDSATRLWRYQGSVSAHQQSTTRQAVLDLLRQHGEMTPKEVAEALEKPSGTITSVVFRLVKEGMLVKRGRGQYACSSTDAPTDICQTEDHE